LSFSAISSIFQICSTPKKPSLVFVGEFEVNLFLQNFAGHFTSKTRIRRGLLQAGEKCTQFHIRFFSVTQKPKDSRSEVGLRCYRESSETLYPKGSSNENICVMEKRISILAATQVSANEPTPSFTMIILSDLGDDINAPERLSRVGLMDASRRTKVRTYGMGSGIMTFQLVMYQVIDIWEMEWTNTLDEIEAVVRVGVGPSQRIQNFHCS
jgi:hypothetical protein